MKKGVRIFFIIFFFLSFLNSLISAKEIDGPKALFFRKSFNFGKIKEGNKVSTIFNFKNIGTKDLVVKKIRVSCGCTATLLSTDVLKPGEMGELKVTLDSKGLEEKIKKSIYFHSNDPKNPVIQLIINSIVEPRS